MAGHRSGADTVCVVLPGDDATEAFAALMRRDEAAIPLDEACLLIAAHADPTLDVAAELSRLDDLAAQVRRPTLDGLRGTLFSDLGFTGDRTSYYDPRNSYLHEVVRRRRGIPITLSILAIAVGRRVGVPLEPVGMPGHFLLRDKVDRSVFLDAFDGGAVLDADGCRARYIEVAGDAEGFSEDLLRPAGNHAVVARVLANLASVHRAHADHEAVVWVQRLRLAIPTTPRTELVDLASALVATGRYGAAADAFDQAAGVLDGELRDGCLRSARRMRARLN